MPNNIELSIEIFYTKKCIFIKRPYFSEVLFSVGPKINALVIIIMKKKIY